MIVPFQHIGVPVGLTNTDDNSQPSQSTMDQQQVHYPVLAPIWMLGGRPTVGVDVPITAVFLVLFMIGAATNMTIYQLNKRKGHKFLMSLLLFGFCMARIVTCIMRIAWITHLTNISLGIAAQVFVAVGVIILYVVNLIFAQRMIRASHPHIGWTSAFSIAFKILYGLVLLTIIMLITVTIQSFFTINTNTHRIDRDVQLYGVTCFAILAFLPIPMVLALLAIPRSSPLDKFGRGRWRTKIYTLLAGATLICFGASYRAGTSWKTPVPNTEPLPAYDHKAAFYIANFGVEILTVYLYAILRVDLRFHVPDGASARKNYNKNASDVEKAEIPEDVQDGDDHTFTSEETDKKERMPSRVYSEEETFDDDLPESFEKRQNGTATTEAPLTAHAVETTHGTAAAAATTSTQ